MSKSDISMIESSEGETVDLIKSVNIDDEVEIWMGKLVKSM